MSQPKRRAPEPLDAETLTQLFGFLLKRSDEAYARNETLRRLLVHYNVFSASDFDELFARVLAGKRSRTAALLFQVEKEAHSEKLRRLLEAFEGTLQ